MTQQQQQDIGEDFHEALGRQLQQQAIDQHAQPEEALPTQQQAEFTTQQQ
jgi:hypothetical protein